MIKPIQQIKTPRLRDSTHVLELCRQETVGPEFPTPFDLTQCGALTTMLSTSHACTHPLLHESSCLVILYEA